MIFTNPNDIPVWVNLYINTGWTIPPPEFATGARDTFFQNDWILIAPGQTRTIVLDFSSTQVWNAADDPEAGNQFPNGATGVALFRCDEVSHIGFQVRSDLGSAQSLELRVRQGIPDAPVGGISTPVNKLAVLAPYIALACVIATTVGIVAFKRAKDQ